MKSQTTQYTTNLPGLDFIERGIIWKKEKKRKKKAKRKQSRHYQLLYYFFLKGADGTKFAAEADFHSRLSEDVQIL